MQGGKGSLTRSVEAVIGGGGNVRGKRPLIVYQETQTRVKNVGNAARGRSLEGSDREERKRMGKPAPPDAARKRRSLALFWG